MYENFKYRGFKNAKNFCEKIFRDRDHMFVGKTAQIGFKNFIFKILAPILEVFPTKVRSKIFKKFMLFEA